MWATCLANAREAIPGTAAANSGFYISQGIYDPIAIMRIRLMQTRAEQVIWTSPDSASHLLKKAMAESLKIGYPDGVARAHIAMGVVETSRGAFDRSMACYQKAYPYVLQSAQKDFLLCGLYINIGVTYFYQSEYEQASYYYYLVLQHMLKYNTNNFNIIMTYNNLADVMLRMEQYDQADYYISKGEELLQTPKDLYLLSMLKANKAGVMTGRGDDSTALLLLDTALMYARRSNNEDVMPAVWNTISEILLRQHRPAEAIGYLEQALHADHRSFPYYSVIAPGYNLGKALHQIGKHKEAEEVLLKALHTAEKAGIREGKPDAVATLATVYEALGQPVKALEQQKRFSRLQDSMLDREKIKAINAMEARFRTAEKDRELIRKQLELSVQRRKIDRKNLWLGLSVAGILFTGLFSLAVYQRNKDRQVIAVLEAMIAGEEKERCRVAQELHDGIGGLLAGIQMRLSMVQADNIADIEVMTKEAASEIRRTAHNLMPEILQRCSFAEAVDIYCENLSQAGKLRVDLLIHEPLPISDKYTELSLYRIIQEVLQNIVKHAQATSAVVQISQLSHKLNVIIEDNGKGFDTLKTGKGLGIHNLHLRAKKLKGSLTIESAPGRGTIVTISIPV
jgi:signal transduction histidine kinase/Tfp pilus assembly protein PilF